VKFLLSEMMMLPPERVTTNGARELLFLYQSLHLLEIMQVQGCKTMVRHL